MQMLMRLALLIVANRKTNYEIMHRSEHTLGYMKGSVVHYREELLPNRSHLFWISFAFLFVITIVSLLTAIFVLLYYVLGQ
jgi:hypothetical protein